MNFYLLFQYINYKIFARHKHGHGIHSPFVYKLLTEVIEDEKNYYTYFDVEQISEALAQNKQKISITDLGAKSQNRTSSERTIAGIFKNSAISTAHGKLLFRLVNHFKPSTILELGTCLGISTIYLASPSSKATVYTIEGDEQIRKVALTNFSRLNIQNIKSYLGNFDEILPQILTQIHQVDFVFIDGNHRYEPTIRYFELCLSKSHNDSIFVFHDIHWSKQMYKAWQHISRHPKVSASIDLFYSGIVFFRKEMQQQQFRITF